MSFCLWEGAIDEEVLCGERGMVQIFLFLLFSSLLYLLVMANACNLHLEKHEIVWFRMVEVLNIEAELL